MKSILEILSNRKLSRLLVLLNIFASIGVFIFACNLLFPDVTNYLNLAKSLEHGKYSLWYFLDIKAPDTLRTPGYPLFIFFLRTISDSVFFIKFVQLIIYYVTLFLSIKLLNKFSNSLLYKNLFLIILLPNVQIVYYTGCIAAETLNILFIILLGYAYYSLRETFVKHIVLGLISGVIFLIRPIFLLFPILFILYDSFFAKKHAIRYKLIYIVVYGIMLMPYSLWNYSNHGIFKITPLESGAAVLYVGYWQHKLPGYQERHYWWHYMGDEIVKFVKNDNELNQNINQYNQQWQQIYSDCSAYFTKEDAQREKLMSEYNAKNDDYGHLITYSSSYMQAREKILLKYWLMNVKKDPIFFIKTRLYTAIRLWVTGINTKVLSKAKDLKTIIKVIYPFLITFTTFVFGFLFIAWGLVKKIVKWKEIDFIILLIIYYGLIHIPFAIQSRYTIPVHLLVILLISLVSGNYLKKSNPARLLLRDSGV